MTATTQSKNSRSDLKHTPLARLHQDLGARMVPFAGYEMPVQYPAGIIKEHTQVREAAGLFDVSHMGQVMISGANAAGALEKLVPGNIKDLKAGRQRYTQLTNEKGGILDDFMVSNLGDVFFIVVNAACKDDDIAHLETNLKGDVRLEVLEDRALLALQGPKAADVMADIADISDMVFMDARTMDVDGLALIVSRSGYTGEDGFEISVPAAQAEAFARRLLEHHAVEAAGLGARDSLRLEAGLCLYGNDIDETTTPVEADLGWSIGKRRREEGGFLGDTIILEQLENGPQRKRVGLKPEGRMPVRQHAKILDEKETAVGEITSGGFGPTAGGPIAMGYVPAALSDPGTKFLIEVRGKTVPAQITDLPFVPHRYHRK